MRKIIVTIFLAISLVLASLGTSYAARKGTGEVKLSQGSLNNFIRYIRGEVVKGERWTPMMFILSSDGKWSKFWYCPYAECRDAHSKETIADCEQATNVKCGVFAKRRTIYWDNGRNKKKLRVGSKWSVAKIKEELTKAGFWGDEKTSSTTTTSDTNLTEELKELSKLYEDGVLTKEEFKKAKDKVLNK